MKKIKTYKINSLLYFSPQNKVEAFFYTSISFLIKITGYLYTVSATKH